MLRPFTLSMRWGQLICSMPSRRCKRCHAGSSLRAARTYTAIPRSSRSPRPLRPLRSITMRRARWRWKRWREPTSTDYHSSSRARSITPGVGQADHFLVPKLVAHFAERRSSIELGNLDVVRDFSDVRGIAEAYVRLLTAEVSGGITNLCSGVGHPLRWILRQLSELSGHELELKVNEAFVRTSEVHRLVGSNAIMRAALGELPFSDFRETLKWMLDARAST